MRPADLLNRLEDHPFKPFRVHLSDGTMLAVSEPGMVLVGRSSAVLPTAFTRDGEGHRIAEHWRTISLIHIVQFSSLGEPMNGKRRRGKN